MSRETDIKLLMDNWEEKHKNNGYKRFIRDGIVCEEKWEAQHTPRVCYFLKEAYTSNENGYNLVEDLHDCERPWTMWRKVAIWTQAIYNAFNDNICEYDDEVLRSKEKEIIDRIAVVNVKKSNGGSESEYEDLKKYALEDRLEIKRELEIIQPDIIVCGNNLSLLKLVLGEELQNDDTWDNMLALWKDTLVLDYYHPAVHYPTIANEVLYSIAISASGLKNRKKQKGKEFEMRIVDNFGRRYKWSKTEITCSLETMELVFQDKVEKRTLYIDEYKNGSKVEYVGP